MAFFLNHSNLPVRPPLLHARPQISQKLAKKMPVGLLFPIPQLAFQGNKETFSRSKRVNESWAEEKKYARNSDNKNFWRTLSELGRGIKART